MPASAGLLSLLVSLSPQAPTLGDLVPAAVVAVVLVMFAAALLVVSVRRGDI